MTHATITRPVASPRIIELPSRHAAVVRVVGSGSELPHLLSQAFEVTAHVIGQSGATIVGHPFARYLAFGERIEAEVGFPFVGKLVPGGRVYGAELPGGRAVALTFIGPYEELATAWERTKTWMGEQELEVRAPAWESYLTSPHEPGPPVTEIVWPIR